jgi:hypothetical protein
MKKSELFSSIGERFNKTGFQIMKHSPEILVVVGVAGFVVSAVMACKATTKVGEVLEVAKKTLDDIQTVEADESLAEKYSPEDAKKDKLIVYVQTGVKLAVLYGPAIAVGVASIGCVLASHKILGNRNIGLAAAYATVDNSFKEYRNQVIQRFGKKVDEELKYKITSSEVEETVIDEDGNAVKVKKVIESVGNSDEYSRFFDSSSRCWEDDPGFNIQFLKGAEKYFNNKLKSKGYVFLNDVYDYLGMEKTKAGQVVGWYYDLKSPTGDNYIDFNMFNGSDEDKRRFVNGTEPVILLDFNVDGNIWTRLKPWEFKYRRPDLKGNA